MTFSNSIILPNNFLAEQSILNILITHSSAREEILNEIKPNCFYFEPHRLIYEVIYELSEKNIAINLTTLISKLQDKNYLKKIGGIEKIITILNQSENFSALPEYLKQINEKYLRRLIINLGQQFINWGYTTSENLDVILDNMEEAIYSLTQQKSSQKIYSIAETLDEAFLKIQGNVKEKINTGFNTNFKDLDAILQGFQKSDLIIIAGRPSMGKTAFALNLAKNIVKKYDIPLIIFTLEMSRQQIIYRFLSNSSNINPNRLKSGKMNQQEWKELSDTMKQLSTFPIYIDDNPNLTLIDIRSTLRKFFSDKVQTGLVIIDYLQLMKVNLKFENRVQEISYLTRNLKLLAKEFEIPIILLSQLSRNVESRINKRPVLSDLRESGCLSYIRHIFYEKLKSWKNDQIVKNSINDFNFKGIKPIFILGMNSIYHIKLTANHKILTKQGWLKIFHFSKHTKLYFVTKNKKFKNLFNYDYYALFNIKYRGIYDVYDKTIPFFHNYFLKNFILHNSIEQDADIVIMLYREDYYTEKNNVAKNQITEFIIAKHRNGPIGKAELIFDSTSTSFLNKDN